MKPKVRFFQISVNEDFIFGLDSNGHIWRLGINPAVQPQWVFIESPEVPESDLLPRSSRLDGRPDALPVSRVV